ncbi:hypothetical protein CEXT_87151 [Caerostris extrusa]|uniref:Uncharacterized protein n=1 Tax=Caerostris extrusa TaxID=172846 RepID=A0AAV4T8Z9_CAEEX|nr:hypothetical protein CEXT_87151 [Caerostris extrusa]
MTVLSHKRGALSSAVISYTFADPFSREIGPGKELVQSLSFPATIWKGGCRGGEDERNGKRVANRLPPGQSFACGTRARDSGKSCMLLLL